jgi:hypothetical protein
MEDPMGDVGRVILTKRTEEGDEQQAVYNAEFIDTVNKVMIGKLDEFESLLQSLSHEDEGCDCEELTEIDGNNVKIQVTRKRKDNPSDDIYVPRVGELVYIEDVVNFTIGDGITALADLPQMFSTFSLAYTPENTSNKGQASGYVPLDENLKIPVMYMPSIITDVYEKDEVDNLLAALTTVLTQLVNTEAQGRQTADTDIRKDLDDHIDNNVEHVSQNDRDRWDDKLDNNDLTPYENHINDVTPHITTAERNRWNNQTTAYICQNIAERNAIPTGGLTFGDIAFVKSSASGVTPITYDKYFWFMADGWNKDSQAAQLIEIAWSDIKNRPNAVAATIDNTVSVAHTHNNMAIINKFTQSQAGRLIWNGIPISSPITFHATQHDLPMTGAEDHIYVVYRDSRCNNFPSIGIWNGGGYELLGKGTNDAPPAIGDMVVLQRELYNVIAGTIVTLSIAQNDQIITFPIEVLKMKEGDKNQIKSYCDFAHDDHFEFKDYLVFFNNGLCLDSMPRQMEMIRVDELYIHSLDIDLMEYTQISGVY